MCRTRAVRHEQFAWSESVIVRHLSPSTTIWNVRRLHTSPFFLLFFLFPLFFDLYFVLPFFLLLLAFSFIVFTYIHTNIYTHTCTGIFPRRFTLAGIDDARARVVLRRRGKIYYHGPRGRGIIEQFVLRYRFNSIAPFLCPFFRAETFIFFIFHSIDTIYYATILCFMK